ncbi:hypothetical protein M426DRAFT_316223, partial [Hypoxylon sp. CI-4A]
MSTHCYREKESAMLCTCKTPKDHSVPGILATLLEEVKIKKISLDRVQVRTGDLQCVRL